MIPLTMLMAEAHGDIVVLRSNEDGIPIDLSIRQYSHFVGRSYCTCGACYDSYDSASDCQSDSSTWYCQDCENTQEQCYCDLW